VITALLAAAVALPTPLQLPTVARLAQAATPIYCAGARGRSFALTFDDGPSPYTMRIVRVLRRAHARATFFDVGSRLAFWPQAARAAATVGEIGNHTWSHPHLPDLSHAAAWAELARTQAAAVRDLRITPRLFRPPYDVAEPADDLLARQLGLLDVRWSVDSGDSRAGTSAQAAARAAIAGLHPGAIVLLHDPHATTPAVAHAVLRAAARRRLRPVTVSTLLAEQPPSAAQLAAVGGSRCPGG
jgi:peptidoglycan/xylan/chitin deacetylase (PgdA/CDA1 family)